MARYALANVSWHGGYSCTESEEAEWFLNELKKLVPERTTRVHRFASREPFKVSTDKLRDPEALQWVVIKRLCEDGWEPFAPEGSDFSFRKRIE